MIQLAEQTDMVINLIIQNYLKLLQLLEKYLHFRNSLKYLPAVTPFAIGAKSNDYNSGKDIHIKPSKRGTFTKAAKQHGMSVQGFANKVLRNPSKYSAAMRKKANFAHNASKWNK